MGYTEEKSRSVNKFLIFLLGISATMLSKNKVYKIRVNIFRGIKKYKFYYIEFSVFCVVASGFDFVTSDHPGISDNFNFLMSSRLYRCNKFLIQPNKSYN